MKFAYVSYEVRLQSPCFMDEGRRRRGPGGRSSLSLWDHHREFPPDDISKAERERAAVDRVYTKGKVNGLRRLHRRQRGRGERIC